MSEPIGAGSFGTTWRAEDDEGRPAVVKLLKQLPSNEIRALSRVSHPAVVRLTGSGTVPTPWIAMQLAPGVTLSQWSTSSPTTRFLLLATLLDALEACHRAGITHGDVKPDNIIVDDQGHPMLVDFGLAGGLGGTPDYAAPEVLAQGRGGPPSDVYSLGLVAYQLWHGTLPDAELDWALAASRRSQAPPVVTEGPAWFRELLQSMLEPDPERRRRAHRCVDTLAAQGFAPPPRDVADLREHAGVVMVSCEAVDPTLKRWLDRPFPLVLHGPSGSGRTHGLRRVGSELRARGIPFVSLVPTSRPWGPIAAALADPGLGGPPEAMPAGANRLARARQAAMRLLQRTSGRLHVLVDDLDQLDVGTRHTVRNLVERGAAVLAATKHPPSWIPNHLALPPFNVAQQEALCRGILGEVDAERVVAEARRLVGGWPGPFVQLLLRAVETGALSHRRGRWLLAEGPFRRIDLTDLNAVPFNALPQESLRLGAVIGVLQPVPLSVAAGVAEVAPSAVMPLRRQRLVSGRERLRCANLRVATGLLGAVDTPRALWAQIAAHLWSHAPEQKGALGWALVGAEDRRGVLTDGPTCLQAAARLDVHDAGDLATRMVEMCPNSRTVLVAAIDAWIAAGEVERARDAAQTWMSDRTATQEDLPLLLAMARLEDMTTEDAERALRYTKEARGVIGEGPVPRSLRLIEARAYFRGTDHSAALQRCAPLCPDDAIDDVESWLEARALLAQIRAEQTSVQDGLATLDLPEELGRGTRARATVEGVRGRLLWLNGQPREAAMAMQQAATQWTALPSVDQARLQNNAAVCWYVAGDVERAVADWEAALLSFEDIGATLEVLRVHVNLCQGFCDLGRWKQATTSGEEAVRLAQARGDDALQAVAEGNLGDVALWRREFDQAEQRYRKVEALMTDAPPSAEGLRRWAELHAHQRSIETISWAERAIAVARDTIDPIEAARAKAVLSVGLARAGRSSEAKAVLTEALDVLRPSQRPDILAIARLWAAETLLELRKPEQARQLCVEVQQYAIEIGRVPLRMWADAMLSASQLADLGPLEKLDRLTQLSVRVCSQTSLDEVLDELAQASLELIEAQRSFVMLLEGSNLRIRARAGDPSGEARPAESIVRRALSLGREIVVTDLEERADLNRAASVVAMDLKAVMCAPLFVDGVVEGVLYLDSRQQPIATLGEALALVRCLAAHGSVSLRNARLTDGVRMQARLAREVAHDLRNPLSGVLMLLEDLAEGEIIESHEANRAAADVRHALALVEATLHARQAPPEVFPFAPAVRTWTRSLLPQARAASVELAVEDDGGNGQVLARATELRRAIGNVLGNAIKFSPPQGTVRVSLFGDAARVGVRIDDEGPGISDVDAEKIFQVGVQVKGTEGGHGLGLHIARRICREHGGDISVRRLDQGTRFELWFPRVG
ncbi:MAG: ATP-binding protein [Myxococcota bacterium]